MKTTSGELSERKKQILKTVIEAYIETGEPVGSKYLMQKAQFPFSSATIRNEMAELEELGYLEQPHTSAGRIPSESGYRFYVDSLVEHYDLTNREITELKSALRSRQTELDNILDSAMKLASSMTNYPALAVRPHAAGLVVSRFETVPIDTFSLLLVMVMPDGSAKTKTVKSPRPVTREACTALAAALNTCLSGVPAAEFTLPLMMDVEKYLGAYDFLANPAIKRVYEVLAAGDVGDLRVEGVNRLLSYPEYCDFDRLKNMLTMFEDKQELLDVVASGEVPATGDDIRVLIGRENPLGTMENSTLIFKPVKRGGHTVGAIGIIGPTRMDYPRVIAMINELSASISELMDTGAAHLPALGDGTDNGGTDNG